MNMTTQERTTEAVDLELAIKEALTITNIRQSLKDRQGRGKCDKSSSKGFRCVLMGGCWPGGAGSG